MQGYGVKGEKKGERAEAIFRMLASLNSEEEKEVWKKKLK